MPSPKPEPLSPPLSIWLVNPLDDVPGEGFPALRTWSLARVLAARGHDVTWWSASWSRRRQAIRSVPPALRDDEGFSLRLVAVRPYEQPASFARIGSHRDFGRTFARLASEAVAAGQVERPDLLVATLPPLEAAEAAIRVGRKLEATVVVDLEDLWPEACAAFVPGPAIFRGLLGPWLARDMRARRRAILEGADAVSATAAGLLEAVAAEIPAATPRHVCPMGAYPQEFPDTPRGSRHVPAAGLPPAVPPLECVCSTTPDVPRDLDALVAAARILAAESVAATIHVVGPGPLPAPIARAAAALTGPCRIVHHAPPNRRDYARLLAACDVGIVSARPEVPAVLPHEAEDYAAAGLVLVGCMPGELARLVERYDAGVPCAAGDGPALARAIAGLAGDRRRLASARRTARSMAAAEFDRERIYPGFAGWLETLSA